MGEDVFPEDAMLRSLLEVSPPDLWQRITAEAGEHRQHRRWKGASDPARRAFAHPLLAAVAVSLLVGTAGAVAGLAHWGGAPPASGGAASNALRAKPSDSPPQGVSEGQADDIALNQARHFSSTAPTVASSSRGHLRDFWPSTGVQGTSGDTWVWAVVVDGDFRGICAPVAAPGATPPCATSMREPTSLIILDYRTGRFIVARSPATRAGPGHG